MVWGKQPLSGPGLHFFYLHICMTSKSPITTRLPKTRQLDTKAQLRAVGENKGRFPRLSIRNLIFQGKYIPDLHQLSKASCGLVYAELAGMGPFVEKEIHPLCGRVVWLELFKKQNPRKNWKNTIVRGSTLIETAHPGQAPW